MLVIDGIDLLAIEFVNGNLAGLRAQDNISRLGVPAERLQKVINRRTPYPNQASRREAPILATVWFEL